MGRDGLTRMTKIEVVTRGSDEARVREVLEAADARGYTSLGNVSGLGHHGYHRGRLLFNEEATLQMLISVVPDEKADAVIEGLRELFKQRPGVMFVSDTYVSRPEYFG